MFTAISRMICELGKYVQSELFTLVQIIAYKLYDIIYMTHTILHRKVRSYISGKTLLHDVRPYCRVLNTVYLVFIIEIVQPVLYK